MIPVKQLARRIQSETVRGLWAEPPVGGRVGFCGGRGVWGRGDFCPVGFFPGRFLWLDFFRGDFVGGFYPGTGLQIVFVGKPNVFFSRITDGIKCVTFAKVTTLFTTSQPASRIGKTCVVLCAYTVSI